MAPERFYYGTYTYRGEAILSGTAEHSYNESLGHHTIFFPERPRSAPIGQRRLTPLQEFVLLDSIHVDEVKIGSVHLPPYPVTDRWCAKVTLRITELQIDVADTGAAGSAASDFSVVHSEKFQRGCGTKN
jgi:hypothetical protein